MFIGDLRTKLVVIINLDLYRYFAISGWTRWMTSFAAMAARLLLRFEAFPRGDTCYKNAGGVGGSFVMQGMCRFPQNNFDETLMRNISRPTSHL